MSGYFKKAVVWLGLDEQYPEHDGAGLPPEAHESALPSGAASNGVAERAAEISSERRVVPRPGPVDAPRSDFAVDAGGEDELVVDLTDDPLRPVPLDPRRAEGSSVRAVPLDSNGSDLASGTVRAVPLSEPALPETLAPSSFNNAQDVADIYMRSKPVVLDLSNASRDLRRRLIDFSAGLCYGLGGNMEKIENHTFLLVPEGVEVSARDREML